MKRSAIIEPEIGNHREDIKKMALYRSVRRYRKWNRTVPILLLILVIFTVYWPALYEIPRIEHVSQLLGIDKNADLGEILANGYRITRYASTTESFTKTSVALLSFKPIYYIFPGFNWWAFGENFYIAELISIIFHIVSVVLLFLICLRITRNTILSFSLALFLAVQTTASEAVAGLLATPSVLSFASFLGVFLLTYKMLHRTGEISITDKYHNISFHVFSYFFIVLFGLIATFSYEPAAVLLFLLSLLLLVWTICLRRNISPTQGSVSSLGTKLIIFAPFTASALYTLASLGDLAIHDQLNLVVLALQGKYGWNLQDPQPSWYEMVPQWIWWWLKAAFFPLTATYDASGRVALNFKDVYWQSIYSFVIGLIVLSIVAAAAEKIFFSRKRDRVLYAIFPVFFVLCIISFALILVLSRGAERGSVDGFFNATHYSYWFVGLLMLFIGSIYYKHGIDDDLFGTEELKYAGEKKRKLSVINVFWQKKRRFVPVLLVIGLAVPTAINGKDTLSIRKKFLEFQKFEKAQYFGLPATMVTGKSLGDDPLEKIVDVSNNDGFYIINSTNYYMAGQKYPFLKFGYPKLLRLIYGSIDQNTSVIYGEDIFEIRAMLWGNYLSRTARIWSSITMENLSNLLRFRNTNWRGVVGSTPQFLAVEFGKPTKLQYLHIYASDPNERPNSIDIFGSWDGVHWTHLRDGRREEVFTNIQNRNYLRWAVGSEESFRSYKVVFKDVVGGGKKISLQSVRFGVMVDVRSGDIKTRE